MSKIGILALILPLCLGLKADIRGDTNRDGTVDITGDTDVVGKGNWSESSGAVFLANIGDTGRRCSLEILRGPAPSNDVLGACNDASDDIQRSAQYLAPLRTLPIPELSDEAFGTVSVDSASAKYVRIFRRNSNNEWTITRSNDTFRADQLKAGMELGIDARDTRRPGQWDGRTTVRFDVTDGTNNSTDKVMLRVAPILTHTHIQRVVRVLTTAGNTSATPWQEKFSQELSSHVEEAGIIEKVYQFNQSDDIWAQDFIEPGYTSMPGPNGTVSLRVMIRSGQDERVAGRQLFEYLRDAGWGAVQQLGGARDEINSMGNLETIPPYEFNGKKYPAGRIIMGSHGAQNHHMLPFMQAQEIQDPLILDADWLAIGHVDEFIQFLPANSPRGWVVMVDDPNAGINMLRDLQKRGHGTERAYSRNNDTGINSTNPILDPGALFNSPIPVPSISIDEAIAQNEKTNVECANRIAANIEILKKATGVTDDEIYRLPAIFTGDAFGGTNNTELKVTAFYPGMINGVVLSNSTYLAPTPWGPVVDGIDVLADAASTLYKKAGLTVKFIDDWNTHHNFGGEVHCGTNTVRQADQAWW